MKTKHNGFTIIEMLIVVLIIGLLAALVFNLSVVANQKNAEAETRGQLEKLANALEEYRSHRGSYPPVDYYIMTVDDETKPMQPMEYEYPVKGGMSSSVASTLYDASRNENIWSEKEGRIYTFGLMSYLFPRYNNHAENSPPQLFGSGNTSSKFDPTTAVNQWKDFNRRTDSSEVTELMQDIQLYRKILPYLGVSLDKDGRLSSDKYGVAYKDTTEGKRSYGSSYYTNVVISVRDKWRRPLRYESKPPYDSYRLWSLGADGKNGTADDIYAGKEEN